MNNRLSHEEANKIGGAIARLAELNEKKLVDSNTAAEKRGLESYLQSALVQHAGEFLSCWFVVRHEYEPLVSVFAAMQRRITGINTQPPQKNEN